jgi:HPt (histidine-containing phosphotransfer) domain-containing protein
LVVGEDAVSTSSLLAAPEQASSPGVIDEDHLARMTLGDRGLEREVLEIFARQAMLMLQRIMGAKPPLAAAAAHTLKGSARGIGAWRVAEAAERLEHAVAAADSEDAVNAAIAELEAASAEARAAIGTRLSNLPHRR